MLVIWIWMWYVINQQSSSREYLATMSPTRARGRINVFGAMGATVFGPSLSPHNFLVATDPCCYKLLQ